MSLGVFQTNSSNTSEINSAIINSSSDDIGLYKTDWIQVKEDKAVIDKFIEDITIAFIDVWFKEPSLTGQERSLSKRPYTIEEKDSYFLIRTTDFKGQIKVLAIW